MNKKLSYLMSANMIAQSNKILGNDILNANKELGEKLEAISNAEIKSKDRVDISLEEYEKMKREIKSLSSEVYRLSRILERIDVPLDKEIIPDSIRTYWCDDALHCRHKFIVEFAIDDFNLGNAKEYFRR